MRLAFTGCELGAPGVQCGIMSTGGRLGSATYAVLLALGAVLVAAIFAALAFVLRPWGLKPFASVPYLVAAAGSLSGALAFGRQDRMRWAWLSLAAGDLIGWISCAFARPPLHAAIPDQRLVSTISDLLLNLLTVTGLVIFAQAWRALVPRPGWYRLATVIAFVVGALVVGPPLVQSFGDLVAGGQAQWSSIFSGLGDLVAISMIGPLAMTAIAMRGGALAWPYLFLTLSTVVWLLFDAAGLLTGHAQTIADLSFAALALTLAGAAGVAHRRLIRVGP
jgi:hypothetical protein